jgi:hypothetical protein
MAVNVAAYATVSAFKTAAEALGDTDIVAAFPFKAPGSSKEDIVMVYITAE